MAEPASGRRTFGPVVLLGLASAALAAVASAKPWLGGDSPGGSTDASMTALDTGTSYPLASALSLVLLAAWGVLLVTRGRARRVFAVLAAVAALGLVAAVVAGWATLPGSTGDSYEELMGRGSQDEGFTGWFWTAAVCSVVALVPAALAVRLAGTWPEMGSRYDAPGAPAPAREQSSADPDRELWHALDEGRDPTDTHRT
ncbi:MAG: Trp biosynthesis-associated membrane protein [Marmoricola sp.]